MKVHSQDPISACSSDQIGHQLGRNRRASPGLSVLPRISEIRHHRRDPLCRSALQRIDADQQLHQIVIGGIACGLDDEDVFPANILIDRDKNLVVGEPFHLSLGQRQVQVGGDSLSQGSVGVARQQLHRGPTLLNCWRGL